MFTKIFSPAKTLSLAALTVLHVEEDVSSGYQVVPSVAAYNFCPGDNVCWLAALPVPPTSRVNVALPVPSFMM